MRVRILGIWVVAAGTAVCAHAQWLNQRTPGTPRLRDGKPNLAAPAPRASNGKPDLSGIWQAEGAPFEELVKLLPGGVNGLGEDPPSRYFFNVLADFKPGEEPLTPEAAARYRRQAQDAAKNKPATLCTPPSVPIIDALPAPFKIVQTSGLIMVLYEADTNFRQIYLDGRKPPEDPQPTWLGYSTGKWEGDSLAVDVTGFNSLSPLDAFGHTHSEAMHVMERFHRRDFGHLDVQVTIDDPKTFIRPFTYKFTEQLLPDTDVIESFCNEDEKDVTHLAGR